jgi:hypothetical protein
MIGAMHVLAVATIAKRERLRQHYRQAAAATRAHRVTWRWIGAACTDGAEHRAAQRWLKREIYRAQIGL